MCLGLVASLSVGAVAPASAAPTIQVSAGVVPVGSTLVVRGSAPRGRTVTLQLLRAGRWENVALGTASSTGSYRLAAPTWWLGNRQVRVWTPSALLSPGGYSTTVGYHVLPRYLPVGNPRKHVLAAPGYRWNPCQVIGWKFNPNGGDGRLLTDVAAAFGALSAATGLRFVYQGGTAAVGGRDHASRAGTQMLVSWATPREVRALAGRNVGMARTHSASSGREYVGASVAMDRTARLRFGLRDKGSPSWGQVALHELAHAVGMSHSTGRRQNLFHRIDGRNHRYGAGDLAGLRRLGAENGCLG